MNYQPGPYNVFHKREDGSIFRYCMMSMSFQCAEVHLARYNERYNGKPYPNGKGFYPKGEGFIDLHNAFGHRPGT